MQALRLAAANAASAATEPRPWVRPGGLEHCYALRRESAQRQLQWAASAAQGQAADAPIAVRLARRDLFVQRPGFGYAPVRLGAAAFDLYVFPEWMPDYLHYLLVLPLCWGRRPITLHCRQSRLQPTSLFLIRIEGPL